MLDLLVSHDYLHPYLFLLIIKHKWNRYIQCQILLLLQMSDHDPDVDDEEENEAIQGGCLEIFSSNDFIMEPGVFNMLKTFVLQFKYILYFSSKDFIMNQGVFNMLKTFVSQVFLSNNVILEQGVTDIFFSLTKIFLTS